MGVEFLTLQGLLRHLTYTFYFKFKILLSIQRQYATRQGVLISSLARTPDRLVRGLVRRTDGKNHLPRSVYTLHFVNTKT